MEYGWLSLLPPMIAIVLAIVTRRVVLSLAVAILAGAVLMNHLGEARGPIGGAFVLAWNDHLMPALIDRTHLQVLAFSLLLGGMVGVLDAGGGMAALVRSLAGRVRDRRGGQLVVWGLGLGIFFDDYANTLLLGRTMRSTADRLRFSRAKLAFLVDSTAAPIAGLALVSTWVATEISLIGEGLTAAGVHGDVTPFSIFLASVPYRFYALLALVLVGIIAWTGRDFGPMLRAEREAWSRPVHEDVPGEQSDGGQKFLWLAAVLPVVGCVVTVGFFLIKTGTPEVPEGRFTGLRYWGEVIGNGDSYVALVWGGAVGLAIALGLGAMGRQSSVAGLLAGAGRGAAQLLPAMLVLWLAWSLSHMTEREFLDTGGFLAHQLWRSGMPGWMLPTAVFATAGFVAFSTGTSWGTMAILTPLSVRLAVEAAASSVGATALDDGGPLLVAVVGAVLAGAIFGDHCSPISDTTVLSSRASGCPHMLHVQTQLPYALLAGVVAVLCGTMPSGVGFPAWASVLVGTGVLAAAMRGIGKRVEE